MAPPGLVLNAPWRRSAVWPLLLAAGLVVASWSLLAPATRSALATARTPLWDMAKNGRGAAELAVDLAALDLVDCLRHLNAHDPWPFGASLLWLPALLAGGEPSLAAATRGQAALFALLPAALLGLAWEATRAAAGRAGALAAGLAAGGLALTSPLLRAHGLVVLREVPGALVGTLALAAWLRARRLETAGAWRLAFALLTLLVLVKYNYGAILAAALLADAALAAVLSRSRSEGPAGALAAGLADAATWIRGASPAARLGVAGLLLLALLRALGVSIGGGAYALLVIALGTLAVRWLRRGRAEAAARWRQLSAARRAGLAWMGAPLALWFLVPRPMHLRGLLDFLENRSSGLGLVDSLAYYPRTVLGGESLFPGGSGAAIVLTALGLGGLVVALAGGSVPAAAAPDPAAGRPARTVALFALLGASAAIAHPYKDPRFLLTTAPAFFLLVAWGAIAVARALRPGPGRPRFMGGCWIAAVTAGALAAALGLARQVPATERLALAGFAERSGDARIAVALAFVADRAPAAGRWSMLGGFNELSPDLARWTLLTARGGAGLRWVAAPPRGDRAPGRLDRWLARQDPQAILVAQLAPDAALRRSADYRDHVEWQVELARDLLAAPAWQSAARFEDPVLGLRLDWMVAAGARPPASGDPARSRD